MLFPAPAVLSAHMDERWCIPLKEIEIVAFRWITERILNKSSPYPHTIDQLSYQRVPSRISEDVSRLFVERVLRASSKRVTTLQLRRVSGSRSDNNRHSSRNFIHRRTFYTTSVPSRMHLGVLFSAWHQRILLVTEQACAVIVWEIRRRGNDRSQNRLWSGGAAGAWCRLPKQRRHLMRLTRNASRDSYRDIAAGAAYRPRVSPHSSQGSCIILCIPVACFRRWENSLAYAYCGMLTVRSFSAIFGISSESQKISNGVLHVGIM